MLTLQEGCPGKDDTGASNPGGAVEDEAPEEGAPKCLSFLSQVCVCVLEGVLPTPGGGAGVDF